MVVEWLVVVALLGPDGQPQLRFRMVESKQACMQAEALIRSTRPSAPLAVQCIDISKLSGLRV